MSQGRPRRDLLQLVALAVGAGCVWVLFIALSSDSAPLAAVAGSGGAGTHSLPLGDDGCTWTFVRYEPSAWEQDWSTHVAQWSDPGTGDMLCKKMREQEALVKAWEEGVGQSQTSGCGALDSRLFTGDINQKVFSRWGDQPSLS
jgi:hypothetical protein